MKIIWNDIDNRAPIAPAVDPVEEIVYIDIEEPGDLPAEEPTASIDFEDDEEDEEEEDDEE